METEATVQATAEEALSSKYSAASYGYFKDPYISEFVKRPIKRAPLINRGYYARVSAIRQIILKFFSRFPDGQLVNFGAGMDTTFFWLSDIYPDVTHFEIDMPEVLAKKAEIIRGSELLSRKIEQLQTERCFCTADTGGYKDLLIRKDKCRMVAVDLSDIESVERELPEAGISASKPTLFLAECVFVYMKHVNADAVLKWASNFCLSPSCHIAYEQMNPSDAFGRVMVKNLQLRGCPLLSIHQYPNMESQIDRYRALGWSKVEIHSMNEVYDRIIDQKDVLRIQRLEVFDEFEEWRLFNAHYFVLVATSKQWEDQINPAKYLFATEV